MADHIQPTKEELEARRNQAIADIDAEDNPQDPPKDPPADDDENLDPPADGEGEDDEIVDEDVDEGDEGEEEEEGKETPPAPKPEEKPIEPKKEEEPVDFEKRYKDSSREAHILYENQEKQNQELDEVDGLPEPTEEQLRSEFPDWEDLGDTQQKLAKKALHSDLKDAKRKEIREKYRADAAKLEERAKEADTFAIHPDTLKKFPKLEGKQKEFIIYASKPSRTVMDLEDLAKLFILDLPEPKKNKGKMFEVGSGGPPVKPKINNGVITDADTALAIRKTDFRKYSELLKAGKIKVAIE